MGKLSRYDRFFKLNKLSYFAFDWDDNILHMPTKIQMDRLSEGIWRPVAVSPSEFAIVRTDSEYRIRDNDPMKAFIEFKDFGPRGDNSFVEDTKYAIDNQKYGPSWNTFIKCLIEGSIFAIITARGHEYDTLRKGVEYIINNCLSENEQNKMYNNCLEFASIFESNRKFERIEKIFTKNELIDTYLNCCKYYGVGLPFSKSFAEEFNIDPSKPEKLEESKQIALGKFIDICNEYGKFANLKVSIGFSDDDKRNVEHIKNYFEKKSSNHINLKLNVFDTSDRNNGVRTKYVNGAIVEYMGAELGNKEASLLRFDGFNSQSRTLQNSTNDFTGYNMQQQAKVANGLYKKDFKKKETKVVHRKKKKKKLKDF